MIIPGSYFLILAGVLFTIGVGGLILRRNALIALMSIELMLNAANLTLLTFARMNQDMYAQGLAFLGIAVAAAEAAVGLAIIVGIFRTRRTTNLDDLTLL